MLICRSARRPWAGSTTAPPAPQHHFDAQNHLNRCRFGENLDPGDNVPPVRPVTRGARPLRALTAPGRFRPPVRHLRLDIGCGEATTAPARQADATGYPAGR